MRLLDPTDIEANIFHVTDEFTFSNGTPPDIRPDIVFFINGVPVIVVETKPATALDGIAEALDDIRYYHRQGPEFLALNQLHALTHLIQFYYGATWNLSRRPCSTGGTSSSAATSRACARPSSRPRRVLRVLTDFILFTRKDDELSKVVLRPAPDAGGGAVRRAGARTREEARGLIWHTQGSGKTYTMIVAAKRLIEDPRFENPTVLMLVDRNELEASSSATWNRWASGTSRSPRARSTCEELLASRPPRADRLDDPQVRRHAGQHQHAGEHLRARGRGPPHHRRRPRQLPHGRAAQRHLLGFTGTPIDQTAYGKGTFKVFGLDDEKGYLDKYSIRESIEDGTTVPLHYALAPNELRVDRETLEREFLDLAERRGRQRHRGAEPGPGAGGHAAEHAQEHGPGRARSPSSSPSTSGRTSSRWATRRSWWRVDREACCLYKEALDQHLPPEYSTVVISQAGKNDPEPHASGTT